MDRSQIVSRSELQETPPCFRPILVLRGGFLDLYRLINNDLERYPPLLPLCHAVHQHCSIYPVSTYSHGSIIKLIRILKIPKIRKKSRFPNRFLGVFHVRFLDFDKKIEKLVKFCTKAMFVVFVTEKMILNELYC